MRLSPPKVRFLALAVALGCVGGRDALADATPRHELTAMVSSGSFVPDDHVYNMGPGSMYAAPPTLYLGLNVDAGLTPRFHLAADAGAELALGWVLGASARFIALERSGFSVSAGAGPLVTLDAPFGAGVFGRVELGARYRFPGSGFVAMLNAGLAYSLQDSGVFRCGTDTCSSYIRRGDLVESFVGSLGYAFDM